MGAWGCFAYQQHYLHIVNCLLGNFSAAAGFEAQRREGLPMHPSDLNEGEGSLSLGVTDKKGFCLSIIPV